MVFQSFMENIQFFMGAMYTLTTSLTLGILLFIYVFLFHIPMAIWGGILSYNYFYKCNSKKVWLEFEKSMYDWFLEQHTDIQRTIIYKLFAYVILYGILFAYRVINFVLFMFIFVVTLLLPYVFLLYYFLFVYLQNRCTMEGLSKFETATGIDIDSSGYIGDTGNLKSNNLCAKECSNTLKKICKKNAKETEKRCKKDCDESYKKVQEEVKKKSNFFSIFKGDPEELKEAKEERKKCKEDCDTAKKTEDDGCISAFETCYSKCTDPADELEEALITQNYKKEYREDLSESAGRAWDQTVDTAESTRRRAEATGSSSVSAVRSAEEQQRAGFFGIFGS